ncbi:hypothetical protein ACT3SP_13945 [Brachybacterium sp. AOP43-C2-M15]|uniref:hypothetical protein n=1 Tax=Brachybacterium sp. AOP43-C2-M15 TaxID=3457661 RepID=UPI0040347238
MIPVGVAGETVDVPVGTPMAGYAARTGPSTGVLERPSVLAIALGGVVLIAADVCALHEQTCREVRAIVLAEAQGRVVECILAATHTHSGPCCARGRLGPDLPVIEAALVTAATEAAHRACAAAVPSRLELAQGYGTGVAWDRRAGREIDPPITLLTARDSDGRAHARLVHFPCHPVVIDAAHREISGDYPAHLREALDVDGTATVFVTGCAGEVNSGHAAESSYAPGSDARTPATARRVGRSLARSALAAETRDIEADSVVCAVVTVQLDLAVAGREEVAAQRSVWRAELDDAPPGARMLLEAWIGWADRRLAGPPPAPTWSGRVGAVRCGDLLLLTLPGEPFLRTATSLEEQLGKRAGIVPGTVLALGYCDGVPGYFPPREEYTPGGYEVTDAHRYYEMPGPFAPGSAERLEAAALSAATEVLDGARLGRRA